MHGPARPRPGPALFTESLPFIMFGQKKPPASSHAFGASMHVAGDCHFQGELRLDGTVLGNVIADPGVPSSVHVGPSARVEGAVQADRIVVAGTVVGAVIAAQRLELLASCRIEGDVSYQAMDMQPGATVLGSFQPQLITPVQAESTPVEPELAEAGEEATAAEPTEPTLDPDLPFGAEEPGAQDADDAGPAA